MGYTYIAPPGMGRWLACLINYITPPGQGFVANDTCAFCLRGAGFLFFISLFIYGCMKSFECRSLQILPVIRMRNRYKSLCTLT